MRVNLVITLKSLLNELIAVIQKHKDKPYLPVWGEIFSILKKVKIIAHKSKRDITFYEIKPMGALRYDLKKKLFVVMMPDVNINIKDNELVDSILQDRFLPKDFNSD